MKTMIMGVLLLLGTQAFADGFYYDRDGKTYWCEREERRDPGGQVKCADTAYRGPFSREESIRLCEGAWDESPALCGIEAYRGPFSKEESISLCQGASNLGPAECAIMAYRGPFSKEESVELCAGAHSTAPAECAIEAYRGPYSKEEAIRMCRAGQPELMLKGLKALNRVNLSSVKTWVEKKIDYKF